MMPKTTTTVTPLPLRRERQRPLSVLMVDPSCYSLPYDSSLATALAGPGYSVTLARSEFLHSFWPSSNTLNEWIGFYPASHGLARRFGLRRWLSYAKGIEHPFSMGRLLRYARAARPDVIHFQWLPLPMVDRWFLRSLASVCPLVLTLHNTASLFHGNLSRWQEFGTNNLYRHFEAVIVHSEFSRRQVVQQGRVAHDRLHVIPHGALEYYRQLEDDNPPEPAADNQTQEVLFFGQIYPYKGLDLLIEAFARLPESLRHRVRLRVAGKPGMVLTELRQRTVNLRIADQVLWQLGFLKEQEIPGLFRRASVAALPYRSIDQSGVLMTALAFDLPVVASRVGGFAEVIQDGIHGHLVEPNDVEALSRALVSIVSNPARQHVMRQAIRTLRAGELSWTSVAGKTLILYERLAGARLAPSAANAEAA